MKNLVLAALMLLLFLLLPSAAPAADQLCLPNPDGTCTFHAVVGDSPWDLADLTLTQQICAHLDGVDLRCEVPNAVTGEVLFDILVNNPGQTSRVFGVAEDGSGNRSTFSTDNKTRDQEPPQAAVVVP